jgi:organic radical activating enzyme
MNDATDAGSATGPSAHLTELFSSVQGEGPYVGVRQIFVRFYGCHRRCVFCDSPETVTAWQPPGFKPPAFRCERATGSGDFESVANPVGTRSLVSRVQRMDQSRVHHSVAFTGGEPLLHADFLRELLPRIERLGLKTYLETAGDLFHELDKLLPWLDIAAMDLKLPSVTHNEPAWDHHRHFLERCIENDIDVFCKTIVSAETDPADLDQAVRLVAETAPQTLFILQPLTPFGEARNPPGPAQLLDWQARAAARLPHVRVIPQCHKMMGAL